MQSRDDTYRAKDGGSYHSLHSYAERSALWDLRGIAMSDADWTRHFSDMAEITTWGKEAPRPAVMLFVPERWVGLDADQRARLAQATSAATYNPYVAIVTRNVVARGVLRVLNWLTEKPHYEAQLFADPQEALAWLEEKRAAKLVALRRAVDGRP